MIKGYQFQFKWFNFLLFIFLFSIFCSLTVWQVIRINEKQAILDQIERAKEEGSYLNLNNQANISLKEFEYFPATAYGSFDNEFCFFLENIVYENKAGKYFYCPFKLSGTDQYVVVNLGWIKNSANRLDLPVISLPKKNVLLKGKINSLRSMPVVMTSDIPNMEVDNLWLFFDINYLKKLTNNSYLPFELRLTEFEDNQLIRKWPEYNPKIGMHIGYVLHWAAFALVTLLLFIKFNFKKVND